MAKKKQVDVPDLMKEKKKNKKESSTPPPSDPEKPTRGLSVGENFGWTGKLPLTLLNEHCQKQKWRRPHIDNKRVSSGYVTIVTLTGENPKTKEPIVIQYKPRYVAKETTNDSKHFSATYTMFRLNYKKNLKMILPNIFRDYWDELEDERKDLLRENKDKHDLLYTDNPFQTQIQYQLKQDQKQKEIATSKESQAKSRPISMKPEVKKQLTSLKSFGDEYKLPSFPRKVWENSPLFDINSNLRVKVEFLIKHFISWPINLSPLPSENTHLQQNFKVLTALGFKPSHVEESFLYTDSLNKSLEWLIFYTPDDDLPDFFKKSDNHSQLTLRIAKDIKFDYLLKRLKESGFDDADILNLLSLNNNDELTTAVKLTQSLIPDDFVSPEPIEDIDSQEVWDQEIQSLKSMLYNIELSKDNKTATVTFDSIKIKLFKPAKYPFELLGIQLLQPLPNYIKLAVLNKLVHYLCDNQYIGMEQIFIIIDFLKENITSIINDPGKLMIPNKYTLNRSNAIKSINLGFKNMTLKEDDLNSIKYKYDQLLNNKDYPSVMKSRMELPAWAKRDQLINLINENQVSLITGETGSGKSTQIVQFLLDHLNKSGQFNSSIICTQPRRISALGLADRISQERLGKVGDEVGYTIRGDNKQSKFTRITFATTGVLLRIVQSFMINSSKSNKFLNNIDYIFVDEVHERSVDADFLLILLKLILPKFKNLKVILMSATINRTIFDKFFGIKINHIHIEGRTFPITDHYLDKVLTELDYKVFINDQYVNPKPDATFFKTGNINYDLIAQLVLHIDDKLTKEQDKGSILIFMPGVFEINQLIKTVESSFSDVHKQVWCIPLHSALSPQEQKVVFKKPTGNNRKVVISTNIAETSITIPDCVAVIDSGRVKTMYFDERLKASKLVEDWCSQAEVMQRRGRSGRITSGNCYHLYTKETNREMMEHPIPEIKRTNLDNLYLIIKSMGIKDVEGFLDKGIDKPSDLSISNSLVKLEKIGALINNELTNLGKYLSFLPIDLQTGKLLIYGCIFGTLENSLILASIQSIGSPFTRKSEMRDRVKIIQSYYSKGNGDLFALLNVVKEYQLKTTAKERKTFIDKNCLSFLTMKEIVSTKTQLLNLLKEIGFIPLTKDQIDHLNRNENNVAIMKSIISGSYYPQIAKVEYPDAKYVQSSSGSIEVDPDKRLTKYWIKNDNPEELPMTRSFIHPSSTLFDTSSGEKASIIHDPEQFKDENGDFDFAKASQNYKIDFTPQVSNVSSADSKPPFIIYGSSNQSTKLYLQQITPTSTLAILLFGGDILYDLSDISQGKISPGIIMDQWLPIKTWCKNAVLIKHLRSLLDQVIDSKLSNFNAKDDSDTILLTVENLLSTQ